MGGNMSRMVGCFAPPDHPDKVGVFLPEPFDGGLGHSFCYVRPISAPSPSHSNSDGGSSAHLWFEGSRPEPEQAAGSVAWVSDHHRMRAGLETSFKAISGASVSANASTPRTITSLEQFSTFANVSFDRAAAFEASSSFNSLPLQPVPRGLSQSGPITGSSSGHALDRSFLSGPIERGFLSGPLERAYLSGPLERGCVSAPIEATDRSLFSAPLSSSSNYAAYLRRQRRSLAHLVKNLSYPVRKALHRSLSKTSSRLLKTQKSLAAPMKLLWSLGKDPARESCHHHHDCPLDFDCNSYNSESHENNNLQWAQGKAGEDRMHVVLSDEHGWLFVGIYDGFSGPDAPDFLLSNLYKEVYKELRGLLCDTTKEVPSINKGAALDPGTLSKKESFGVQPQHSDFCQITEQSFSFPVSEAQREVYVRPVFGPQEVKLNVGSYLVKKPSTNDTRNFMENICDGISECTQKQSQDSNFGQDSEQRIVFPSPKMQNEAHVPPVFDNQKIQPNVSPYLVEHDSTNGSHTCLDNVCDGEIGDDRSRGEALSCGSDNCYRTLNDSSNQLEALGCMSQQQQDCDLGTNISNDSRVPMRGNSTFFGKQRKIWFGRPSPDMKLGQSSCDNRGKDKQCTSNYECEHDLIGRVRRFEEIQQLDSARHNTNKDIDHFRILRALSNALESTERMFLEMADHSLEEMPELLLMGSCVLVMLMKGEDVYVMNVGDSRAILAQVKNDSKTNSDIVRDTGSSQASDSESIGLRDTQQPQELERIMEETASEVEIFESSHTCSSGGPAAESLVLKAVQLTTDHSTNIEEEVHRIQSEHPDDEKSIVNERVKGRLKVTRAFGAGFLKLPRWNDALLEMFRVDYIGTAPYLTCIPAVHHHCLGPNDRFLVLSSDGLYQYLTNDEVVSQVEWFMENFPDGDPAQYLIEELLFRAAKKAGMDFHELLEIPQGDRRKYHDDVSIMVISLEGRIWRSFG